MHVIKYYRRLGKVGSGASVSLVKVKTYLLDFYQEL